MESARAGCTGHVRSPARSYVPIARTAGTTAPTSSRVSVKLRAGYLQPSDAFTAARTARTGHCRAPRKIARTLRQGTQTRGATIKSVPSALAEVPSASPRVGPLGARAEGVEFPGRRTGAQAHDRRPQSAEAVPTLTTRVQTRTRATAVAPVLPVRAIWAPAAAAAAGTGPDSRSRSGPRAAMPGWRRKSSPTI